MLELALIEFSAKKTSKVSIESDWIQLENRYLSALVLISLSAEENANNVS